MVEARIIAWRMVACRRGMSPARLFALAGFLLDAASLIGQFILTASIFLGRGDGLADAIVFYFTFYTILSNCLVALCLAAEAFPSMASLGLFRRPGARTAVAIYITVVALIYAIFLANTWEPQGWQKLIDALLHYVMPALYLAFWFVLVPKGTTSWRAIPVWLLFPVLYVFWAMLRGAVTGQYPYPFIDALALGYPVALRNIVLICLFFAGLSALFIAYDRWSDRSN
jgi:hypothetical protein